MDKVKKDLIISEKILYYIERYDWRLTMRSFVGKRVTTDEYDFDEHSVYGMVIRYNGFVIPVDCCVFGDEDEKVEIKATPRCFDKAKLRDEEDERENIAYNSSEYMAEAIPSLLPHFSSILNHTSRSQYTKNTAYIHASVHRCGEFNTVGKITTSFNYCELKGGMRDNRFFMHSEQETSLGTFDVIDIYTNDDTKLGFYDIDNNVLVTGDLTHEERGVPLLLEIIRLLLSSGVLHKLPEAEVVEEKSEAPKITIGCDPEFELYDFKDHKVIEGQEIIPRETRGSAHGYTRGDGAKFGLDGTGQQIELRPSPSDSVDSFISEVTELMGEVDTKVNSSKRSLSIVGDTYTLGGHIHVGINNRKYKPSNELITLMDHFIGKPLMRLNSEIRGKSEFGSLSAIRIKNWGFEYRTPPSVWMANPQIARIVMKIMFNLVTKYFNKHVFSLYIYRDVTKEDYLTNELLTESEISFLENFISNYDKDHHKDIIAAWVGREKLY